MRLLVDESFPEYTSGLPDSDVEMERWTPAPAADADSDLIRYAKEHRCDVVVFMGEEVLERSDLLSLAEEMRISVVAIAAEDPIVAAEHLTSNLHRIVILAEVPSAQLVWSDRVDRRALGVARRYEDAVLGVFREEGLKVNSQAFTARWDAVVEVDGASVGVIVSARSRRTFQALVMQVRYWLLSQEAVDCALVVVNVPLNSPMVDTLQDRLGKQLASTGRVTGVVGWRLGDSVADLINALREVASEASGIPL